MLATTKLPRGIRLKNNGKYLVDVCVDGVRKNATCDTLNKAIKAQASMKLSLTDLGDFSQRDTWSLAEACEYCSRTRWKAAGNRKSMQTKINAMISYFGADKPISSISAREADGYAASLAEKYKAGTINLYLNGLSAVLRTAYEREMIDKMPKIPHVRNRARRIRFLSSAEEHQVLEYFKTDDEMRDAVTVLLDTGMRKGELFALTARDIDINSGMITVWESKTGVSRSIPMTERVKNIILARLSLLGALFPIRANSFTRKWEKMRTSCGFSSDPDFVPHILRHTCCSRLVQRGAEIVKVSRWMGHSSIATTMIYAHLSPEALADIKNLLER